MKNAIPQKNPVLFSRPKKILWTPPSLKYVSGAPGMIMVVMLLAVMMKMVVMVVALMVTLAVMIIEYLSVTS